MSFCEICGKELELEHEKKICENCEKKPVSELEEKDFVGVSFMETKADFSLKNLKKEELNVFKETLSEKASANSNLKFDDEDLEIEKVVMVESENQKNKSVFLIVSLIIVVVTLAIVLFLKAFKTSNNKRYETPILYVKDKTELKFINSDMKDGITIANMPYNEFGSEFINEGLYSNNINLDNPNKAIGADFYFENMIIEYLIAPNNNIMIFLEGDILSVIDFKKAEKYGVVDERSEKILKTNIKEIIDVSANGRYIFYSEDDENHVILDIVSGAIIYKFQKGECYRSMFVREDLFVYIDGDFNLCKLDLTESPAEAKDLGIKFAEISEIKGKMVFNEDGSLEKIYFPFKTSSGTGMSCYDFGSDKVVEITDSLVFFDLVKDYFFYAKSTNTNTDTDTEKQDYYLFHNGETISLGESYGMSCKDVGLEYPLILSTSEIIDKQEPADVNDNYRTYYLKKEYYSFSDDMFYKYNDGKMECSKAYKYQDEVNFWNLTEFVLNGDLYSFKQFADQVHEGEYEDGYSLARYKVDETGNLGEMEIVENVPKGAAAYYINSGMDISSLNFEIQGKALIFGINEDIKKLSYGEVYSAPLLYKFTSLNDELKFEKLEGQYSYFNAYREAMQNLYSEKKFDGTLFLKNRGDAFFNEADLYAFENEMKEIISSVTSSDFYSFSMKIKGREMYYFKEYFTQKQYDQNTELIGDLYKVNFDDGFEVFIDDNVTWIQDYKIGDTLMNY